MIKQNNINKDWIKKLHEVLNQFQLVPKNYHKYLKAFTHKSYSYENGLKYDYERFEFLGDAAIAWIISNYLFNNNNFSEGEMSIKKARLVSSETLSKAAKSINLEQLIFVGKGLECITDNILENVFESFIGAVASDLGIQKANIIVNHCIIKPYLAGEINVNKPYKTLIQEALMRSSSKEIHYVQINNSGSLKKVKLVFDKITYGVGEGKTIKIAEENAAKDAYSKLNK